MKKITAFLTALVLAAGTILGLHIHASGSLNFHNPKFGYWTAKQKFESPEVMKQNLDQNTLVVMGSSELKHGKKTPYHPQNVFKNNQLNMMLIGTGHYQCLSHAITLAALEPQMQKRKVVLLVSPQWFRKTGIEPAAFASRFSESSYIDMLQNSKLSKETKEYITRRAESLLDADRPTQKRIISYDNLLVKKSGNPLEKLRFLLYKGFLEEKQKQSILMLAEANGIAKPSTKAYHTGAPDWNTLEAQALKDGQKAASNNEFQISDKYYEWKVKPQLESRKGSSRNSSYASSPEYEDLKCFLNVCKDLNIEPMLVLLPVNGRWYDYTEFPKNDLEQFYKNVRDIAHSYKGTQVVDYSEEYYTDHFMEDTIHIGWKGWVKVDEVLYQFGV
ncbi:D-alanyl-lipoteichoic acid biosynthesis protein DltD [Faecalicatena sp. AGMB00832]|uniref:D-alanyl-lipoteichoic acid biosynthesis protein DltD n=1 Tax=Faecalicatena faecalis TaxID=2726362 RepID=A0ABS6D110_9FIRM|nr:MULTISPECIES: D-alanyl-lipoteichoic acid biosynthesis protein DltD [Faecalicatena]MBU3875282.1 D-alanyl-lipoteichoic acid biosynthesis protein DltD [Faecalicatena faecalis]MCI6467918.1 D-alanyl-lipoteichoic acid biosynthesis protein DltD [Faecalicatena sp.]MDY5619440.1 D-alanyl-lipoteichoic acid biosynthesis protein DltD [Lachnospiraceae bacterium]